MISETSFMEMQSKMDNIITTLNDIKVGVSAIEKMRQDGDLSYARLGRTYIYTQTDVDNLIRNNHIEFVR